MGDDERDHDGEVTATWQGAGGDAWVAIEAVTDRWFGGLADRLAEEVAATGARSVLDVGCGTGATTVAIADRIGAEAEVVGLDVAPPMVTAAGERAARLGAPVRFVLADAQREAIEPGGFDAVASRFGVMFFDDPVAAFANLRSATRPGGALRFLVWRPPADNPFMTAAVLAAAPFVELTVPAPDAPGPFGLADAERAVGLLAAAGWADADAEAVDIACEMSEADLDAYLTHVGPVARALDYADDAVRAEVMDRVRPAYAPWVADGRVRADAACWLLRATAP